MDNQRIFQQKRKAVTMSEVLLTLSLVGILAVTMLSLNNFSNNSMQIAATRLAQADSSLKTWGKAITKMNETGLGPAATVKNNDDLKQLFNDYYVVQGNAKGNIAFSTSENFSGSQYDGFSFEPNKDVTVYAAYIGNQGKTDAYGTDTYRDDAYGDQFAVVKIEAKYGQNNSQTMSDEYAVTSEGAQNIASMHVGWKKCQVYKLETETSNEEKVEYEYYCCDPDKVEKEISSVKDIKDEDDKILYDCKKIDETLCQYQYTDPEAITDNGCGYNQNGSNTTTKYDDCLGTHTITKNTCCDNPTVFDEIQQGCICKEIDSSKLLAPGYEFVNDVYKNCQEICPAGTYQTKDENGALLTDEFIRPMVAVKNGEPVGKITKNDSVICFNFRPDRAREITRTFVDPEFKGFEREYFPLYYVCMTQYDASMPNVNVAFKPQVLTNTFGEYISKKGLKQLRIAETEKYAHVTFFFNGGVENVYEGEDRKLIPSPKVATYDMKPQMSAYEVSDACVELINEDKYDCIILNFANCDMVGHTGVFDAAVKAVEAVDTSLGKVVDALLNKNAKILITADHGNADEMFEKRKKEESNQLKSGFSVKGKRKTILPKTIKSLKLQV